MNTDFRIVDAIAGDPSRLRARVAKVVSVETDRTMTIQLAGTTENIPGVNYLDSVPPRPGAGIWVLSDGRDLFGFGSIAADGRTLSPRASRSSTQNIADATDTAVDFDAVNNDLWGAWSVSQSSRLTAPITGRYMAVGTIHFAGNATGLRSVWIEKTGTSTLARVQVATAGAASPTWLNVTTPPFDMIGGTDYLRLMVRQNSGGALTLNQSSTYSPSLSLVYLGS